MLYCRVFFIATIGCERPKSGFQAIREPILGSHKTLPDAKRLTVRPQLRLKRNVLAGGLQLAGFEPTPTGRFWVTPRGCEAFRYMEEGPARGKVIISPE
jgi:hypothetical protein